MVYSNRTTAQTRIDQENLNDERTVMKTTVRAAFKPEKRRLAWQVLHNHQSDAWDP